MPKLSVGTFYNYVDSSTNEEISAGYFARVEKKLKSYGAAIFVFIDEDGYESKIHTAHVRGGYNGFY
jgi:hypothetical protein